MDILYERKQPAKIALARALLVFVILAFTFLIVSEYHEYCILIAVIAVFLMLPTITELKIFNNKVEIRIYYCLAGIYRTHLLKPEDLPRIFPYHIELEPNPDEGGLFVGTLFTKPLMVKHYKFKYSKTGSEKKFSLRLTDEEYKKIITVLN
jgi:hypothetical protein